MQDRPVEFFVAGSPKGIERALLDPATGTIQELTVVGDGINAGFLAMHPTLPIVYATSDADGGIVIALRRNADQTLTEIARQPSGGTGPCHVSVHPSGKALFVANYGGGTVSMSALNADGTFSGAPCVDKHEGSGPDPKRQTRAYAHSFYPHPDRTHVVCADLGADALFVYRVDVDRGELLEKRAVPLPPGSGPRHIAFTSSGEFVYVVNELANTVCVFKWNGSDAYMSLVQTISTLPTGYAESSYCAEIRIHPSGRFIYASNRGRDSISTFSIDPKDGKLALLGDVSTQGNWPRGFEVDPTGKFLIVANQRSDLLVLFRIDEQSGIPSPTGSTLTVEKPACVRFVASKP